MKLTETSAINAALAVSQSDQDARKSFKNSEFEEIKRTAKEDIKSAETEMEVSMLFEEDMKMRAQSKHLFFRNLIMFLIACFVILQCKFPMESGNFTSSDANMSPPGSRAQNIFESGSVIFTLSDVNMTPQGSRRQQLFSESPGGTQRTISYSSLLHFRLAFI